MKQGSDNSREASIFNVIKELISRNITINMFDPSIKISEVNGAKLTTDFKKFIEFSDLIITNRLDDDIKPFSDKVFSRDIFSSDD
jgi:UDPglucose 6-dehydrogenase